MDPSIWIIWIIGDATWSLKEAAIPTIKWLLCLSPSPVCLHLVGGAAVDTFCLLGIRWGVGLVDLKEFVFLLLLLIVFE